MWLSVLIYVLFHVFVGQHFHLAILKYKTHTFRSITFPQKVSKTTDNILTPPRILVVYI